jgi:Na+-translocating ferredoxin:NAD+ oxidoreductase RNF subunit RnfB
VTWEPEVAAKLNALLAENPERFANRPLMVALVGEPHARCCGHCVATQRVHVDMGLCNGRAADTACMHNALHCTGCPLIVQHCTSKCSPGQVFHPPHCHV